MFQLNTSFNVSSTNANQLITGLFNPDILIEISSEQTFESGSLIESVTASSSVFKVRWIQNKIKGNLIPMSYGSSEILLDIPFILNPFDLEIIPGKLQFNYSVKISTRVFNPTYNNLAQKLGISLSLLNSIPQQTLQILNGIDLGLSAEINAIKNQVVVGGSGNNTPQLPVHQNISALRIVSNFYGEYDYSNPLDASSVFSIAGISLKTVNMGDLLSPINNSVVSDSSWNWSRDKPIFLGLNGILTQIQIEEGFLVNVGRVLDPKTIFVNIEEPIQL